MSIEKQPLPRLTRETEEYWSRCSQHELTLQHCRDCGSLQHYPRVVCKECLSDQLELRAASGKGTVYSYTIIHRAPTPYFRDKVPYVVALVKLEEGVMLMSNIIDCEPAKVSVNMPVEVKFVDVGDEQSLPMFSPSH